MSKVIRLEDSTYDELGRFGHWSDTMDSIIRRLLEQVQKQKQMEATIAKWSCLARPSHLSESNLREELQTTTLNHLLQNSRKNTTSFVTNAKYYLVRL